MDSLIENLLKVKATDHRKIQEEIKRNLEGLGYNVKLEKKIWFGREGKIDVFAQKGNYTMGFEVDHCRIRNKPDFTFVSPIKTDKDGTQINEVRRKINTESVCSRGHPPLFHLSIFQVFFL